MTTALFVHHSIGRQIIAHGGLRARLAAQGVALWDHDYNEIGLTDPAGTAAGRAFPVPDDDTDPAGLVALLGGLADGAWDVPEHDVLVLKSCSPNNALPSDAEAERQREQYTRLRELALGLARPVVLLSSPPLVVESTDRASAARAWAQAAWLARHWPGPGLGYGPLFETLTYGSGPWRGTLRLAHRARRPRDSHLSVAGARAAAAAVVAAVVAAPARTA